VRGSRRLLFERRGVATAMLVLLAGWLVFIFAGALGEANEAERRADVLRAEIAELERKVDAGASETEFVRRPAFLELQARAFGMGRIGERPFALADGAPSPPPLPLLGEDRQPSPGETPLEAWLELLFGA
jgi:hypothetical protein